MSEMEKERSKVRDKMTEKEKKLSGIKKQEQANHPVPKNLRVGDTVKVLSMNLKGTVHTLPNAKGDLYVQMGILRSLVNIRDIIVINEDTVSPSQKYGGGSGGNIRMNKSASVSTEINLIGLNSDEAIARLDKYLDDAYIAHLPSVRIVHGKGTGALRKAVHAHLKSLHYVKSFQLAEFGEGDAGVTIATFE
jgi:DNA mismatch repair protein MutS2